MRLIETTLSCKRETLKGRHAARSSIGAYSKFKSGEITMKNLKNTIATLLKDESGQDLIEYSLVAGLIGLGAVAAMSGLATKIGDAFSSVGTELTNAT